MSTFQEKREVGKFAMAITTLELIHVTAVRNLRQTHRSPVIGLLLAVVQSLTMIMGFLLMYLIIGIKTSPIRGDFILYIMSGIFVYMTHIKAVQGVFGADGPTSPMMQHAPLNPVITISAAALSALYQQIFSLVVILLCYSVFFNPLEIAQPLPALGIIILAWFYGIAVGLLLVAIKPWAPNAVRIIQQLYMRINMIASGKMFLASTLPSTMLTMFYWNPLFHMIDTIRGYVFVNYSARVTSMPLAYVIIAAVFMVGLMAEFFTRKRASASWGATQ